MDGNGRWARGRHLPRTAGHKNGVDVARNIIEACGKRGVKVLTLFAFSSENWQRPATEVNTLMELFFATLRREARRLAENGVRLNFIGDKSAFEEKLQKQIIAAEELTAASEDLVLNVAANYGGQWDITQAAARVVDEVLAGRVDRDDITPATIAAHLSTAGLPEPDLFIRTGGEQRISNFLLWQLAYTELYFADTLWPDFDEQALDAAIEAFALRQRRYGMTGDQIKVMTDA